MPAKSSLFAKSIVLAVLLSTPAIAETPAYTTPYWPDYYSRPHGSGTFIEGFEEDRAARGYWEGWKWYWRAGTEQSKNEVRRQRGAALAFIRELAKAGTAEAREMNLNYQKRNKSRISSESIALLEAIRSGTVEWPVALLEQQEAALVEEACEILTGMETICGERHKRLLRITRELRKVICEKQKVDFTLQRSKAYSFARLLDHLAQTAGKPESVNT